MIGSLLRNHLKRPAGLANSDRQTKFSWRPCNSSTSVPLLLPAIATRFGGTKLHFTQFFLCSWHSGDFSSEVDSFAKDSHDGSFAYLMHSEAVSLSRSRVCINNLSMGAIILLPISAVFREAISEKFLRFPPSDYWEKPLFHCNCSVIKNHKRQE